jgi:hypothetical protein
VVNALTDANWQLQVWDIGDVQKWGLCGCGGFFGLSPGNRPLSCPEHPVVEESINRETRVLNRAYSPA